MKRVLLFEVLLECAVGILPWLEVVELAPDLLGPAPGRVGEQRELRLWFARLYRDSTMNPGHGDLSLTADVTVLRPRR